ncbi:CPBP family intramembrane glutamic endopeptidase [Streptococcus oricebi]|uniref:CPBP family intramembrane metalloprotease n=1 Tax=Streptococcus oricebi TaxID=1547447 RepID=A0ABS5B2K8_9STRE|nr:CPBP family intramembrane glutamic endopeptidase [Streptococcus oricebi]MBP2623071.1 CPBP family intramembrane metalloprotease [Streptococcus oricebi]
MQDSISTSKIKKFLFWAFGLGTLGQLISVYFIASNQKNLGTLFSLLGMLAPMVAAFLAGTPVKKIGWKLKLASKWPDYLATWFWTVLSIFVPALIYFLIFPQHFVFKLSGSLLISLLMIFTVWTLVISLAGLGEEVGWRGILYPYLKQKYGSTKGRILGGLIWTLWHLPLLLLMGNLTLGERLINFLPYCINAVTTGIIWDIYYERSQTIWLPAFAHGVADAVGGLTLPFFMLAGITPLASFGAGPTSLFASPFLLVLAYWLTKGEQKK